MRLSLVNGLPLLVVICPTLGVDGFAIYKKIWVVLNSVLVIEY